GGRLQVRSSPSQAGPRTHWRESKTAVLETYLGQAHQTDPDPDVPGCFLDLKRSAEVVRGLGHALPTGLEFDDAGPVQAKPRGRPAGRRRPRPGRPERLVRSVLASRARSEEFGPMVHQAAWERDLFGAKDRVFLGDGAAANWTTQRDHFSTFVPVLD